MHELMGKVVKDAVTGFTGTVVEVDEFLAGPILLGVRAKWEEGSTTRPSIVYFYEEELMASSAKELRALREGHVLTPESMEGSHE